MQTMRNSSKNPTLQSKKSILQSFLKSNKRHLLITGEKRVGKSTLLQAILEDFPADCGVKSIALYDDKPYPLKIVMFDVRDENKQIEVAKRLDGNKFVSPLTSAFEGEGLALLQGLQGEIVMIDEIGYLENDATNYKKKLIEIFGSKRVVGVIKNINSPFITEIKNRDDVFLVKIVDFNLPPILPI